MIKKFTKNFEDILLITTLSFFFILWDIKSYSFLDFRLIIIIPIIFYIAKTPFNLKMLNLSSVYVILFFFVFFHLIINFFYNNYNLINLDYLKSILGLFLLLLLSLFYKKKIVKNINYIVIFSLFIFSVSLLFTRFQISDPNSVSNSINCYFFKYKFINRLIFQETSHLAMVIPILFFYLLFINRENYGVKNIFIVFYYIFILFAFPSTTIIMNTLILLVIFFLLDYKKFFNNFFLFLIIILSLFFILIIKQCNFKLLNLKMNIQDLKNVENNLKIDYTPDKQTYFEKIYKNYDQLPIKEASYKDHSVAVYLNSLKISLIALQEYPFGYGINMYEKAFFTNMGTKIIPPFREIYLLNYNDGSNNLAKLIVEFGIFSFFIIYVCIKYFLNIGIKNNNKFFFFGLIIIQFFRGAGYFNGGFLLILIFMITDLYEKK